MLHERKNQRTTKVFKIQCLGTINVCTRFCANPWSRWKLWPACCARGTRSPTSLGFILWALCTYMSVQNVMVMCSMIVDIFQFESKRWTDISFPRVMLLDGSEWVKRSEIKVWSRLNQLCLSWFMRWCEMKQSLQSYNRSFKDRHLSKTNTLYCQSLL